MLRPIHSELRGNAPSRVAYFFFMALVLALPIWPLSAAAQVSNATAETSDPALLATPEAINAMVARMSDDEVRLFLIDRLEAGAASVSPLSQPTLIDSATGLLLAFITPPLNAIERLPNLVPGQFAAWRALVAGFGGGAAFLTTLALIAGILLFSFAIEWAVRKLAARLRARQVPGAGAPLRAMLRYLSLRLVRELLGLVVFYVVARALGRVFLTPEQIGLAAPVFTYLVWMPRLAAAILRFFLTPDAAEARLVQVGDRKARFLHRHLTGVVLLGGVTLFIAALHFRYGLALPETRLVFWLDSAIYVYIVWIAWQARDGLTEMMRGADPDLTRSDERIAHAYPYFIMASALAIWVLAVTLNGLGRFEGLIRGAHYTTLFWLLAAPAIDTAIRGLVRHLVPPMKGEGPKAMEAYRSTKRSYVRIGRVVAAGLLVLIIGRAWNIRLLDFARNSEGIGDNLVGFLLTMIVGYIAYEAVSLYVNRLLAAEKEAATSAQEEDGGEVGGAGQSRLSTVLPLFLVTAHAIIFVVFALLAIGNLGIDITPLLAGAGIAGLAIGFGAQKLVTDVVSGVFFLIDDAFRVGEYVEIEGTMGAVEKISIRSMQLRHHRGPVHTVPYGEISKLTNYSRDWVIMKLKFMVDTDTDPNKVKKIFKTIGQEMGEDPLYKDDFLQPFKSQGVFDIDDVGMTIRGKFMAKPGKQFMIRKEIYNRVKSDFAANGIQFARREVRVAIPGMEHPEDMTDEQRTAVATAAAVAQPQERG